MAISRMPDDFFDTLVHHLTSEQPVGSLSGRLRIGHRRVIRLIWFVLITGNR